MSGTLPSSRLLHNPSTLGSHALILALEQVKFWMGDAPSEVLGLRTLRLFAAIQGARCYFAWVSDSISIYPSPTGVMIGVDLAHMTREPIPWHETSHSAGDGKDHESEPCASCAA